MRDWTKDGFALAYVLRQYWKGVAIAVFVLLLIPYLAWSATTLENPSPGAIKSGVGLISGWVCDADELEVSFDGSPRVFVPYGSDPEDTHGVCGDADNGFGLLFNYNELGDGPHTITLYADNQAATQVNFSVQTLGTNFLRGVSGQGTVSLSNGATVTVRWEETTQGFTIIGYEEGGERKGTVGGDDLSELRLLLGEWGGELTVGGFVTERDFVFSGIETQADGVTVMTGEVRSSVETTPFILGYAAEVVPEVPISHQYAKVLKVHNRINGRSVDVCQIISFDGDDLVPDSYGELIIEITFTFTLREGGICKDSYPVGPPDTGELYLYPY